MNTARQILKAAADGTPQWLKQRTQGIGGTDAADLVLDTKSRFRMWRDKKGISEPEYISPELQALFDYGHSREPELARIFAARTGERVRNTGTWARKDRPWALANPDRFVGSDGILEIKTTGAYTDAAKSWRAGQPHPKAWVQAHWYAYVTGRTVLWFIAEVDRVPHILGPYQRDDGLIAELAEITAEFWASVQGDEQPEPGAQDVAIAFPVGVEGKTITADPWSDTRIDLDRLIAVRAQIKELEAEAKHITDGIKLELGDAEALVDEAGMPLVTWKTATRKGSIDQKALTEAGVDVDAYRKPSTTYRTFDVKGA